MKAINLREHTDDELQNLQDDTRRELAELRMMQRVGDGSTSMIKMRNLRRDIARIRTVLNERAAAGSR